MTCVSLVFEPEVTEAADGLWGVVREANMAMPTVAEQSAALEFERQVTPEHVGALVSAYALGWSQEPLTPSDICEWHRCLFPAGGYYRSCAAHFSGSCQTTMPHEQIPGAVLCLCRDTVALLDATMQGRMDAWTVMATIHWRFETIHPFSDGNGRVGRILLQYMAGYLHLPVVCLRAAWRSEYIACLEAANIPGLASMVHQACEGWSVNA